MNTEPNPKAPIEIYFPARVPDWARGPLPRHRGVQRILVVRDGLHELCIVEVVLLREDRLELKVIARDVDHSDAPITSAPLLDVVHLMQNVTEEEHAEIVRRRHRADAPEAAEAPASAHRPWERCTMGVGCREAGACYAAAHGEPERCDGEPAEAEPRAPVPDEWAPQRIVIDVPRGMRPGGRTIRRINDAAALAGLDDCRIEPAPRTPEPTEPAPAPCTSPACPVGVTHTHSPLDARPGGVHHESLKSAIGNMRAFLSTHLLEFSEALDELEAEHELEAERWGAIGK